MLKLRGITKNVVVLGWVSMFTDIASEMLYPLIPLFVVGPLGGSPALLGVIEGIAEGVNSGLRWLGGALSDRHQRRKPFIIWGYGISAFSKPLIGLAMVFGWPAVLVGRVSDRFGKSVRSAARDALIADSVEPQYRGVAFGLHRAMDTAGAVIGPLIALGVMGFLPWLPLAWLFVIAIIPGALSVLLAVTAVRDIPHPPSATKVKAPPIFQKFPPVFWHFIAGFAIFSFGKSSDSFLILRSREIFDPAGANGHRAMMLVVLAYAIYNLVFVLAAIPLGKLSDKVGRKPVLVGGMLVYAAVYAGFSYFRSPAAPWVLLGAYGIYQALTDGVTKAMATDLVPKEQRAGAIGLFMAVAGLGQLVGSVVAGAVWQMQWTNHYLMAPFVIGAACALAAVPVIATIRTKAAR
ncbi:MAG TPA: MFS transporter [Sedimentisphaerales bacterium]|nr:MFS transporter [Sedimentisphaerales bacterium]